MNFFKIIIFSLAFFYANQVFSQDFEVSPAMLHYKLDPFESEKKVISITNHSNKSTLFRISYSDYIFDINGKVETVQAKSTVNSCIDWIIPDKDVFEIQPNATYQLKISMQVPKEDYIAHWGYIYIQTTRENTSFNADKENSRTGLNLLARIAIDVVRTSKTKKEASISIKDLKELKTTEYLLL